ncbi:MAG TPA: hemerythrin domain-containing protein [Acidimicrobiales bacterium]|nr:hemerythrin domain-containing protein [Acidimicrobiales bacterium]
MNIFDQIREDHRYSEELLIRIEAPEGQAHFDESGRQDVLQRLTSHASRHEAAEEMVLWPAVRRRLADGDQIADLALEQELDARRQLDLLKFVREPATFLEQSRRLHELMGDHSRYEEEVVLPALRRVTTRVWATSRGLAYRAAWRSGPTRPHPHGPVRPLGLATIGAPAVIVDHLRDRRKHRQPGVSRDQSQSATAVIREDHGRLSQLLAGVDGEVDPSEILTFDLISEISAHDSIERQYLYPVVKDRLQDGVDLYHELISEHDAIAHVAVKIQRYSFHDDARRAWIQEVVDRVRAHVEREEHSVLPALAAHLSDEELTELGRTLVAARAKAPTRPHTMVAGGGAGARLSRRVMGPVDRWRDSVARRRMHHPKAT